MLENERIYFMQQLNLVAQLYNKKLTPELCNLYWEELVNYKWEDVRQAMRICTQKGKFMPKVADIIEQLQFLQAPGKPKVSSNRCAIQYLGDQCPFTASRGGLCSYHGHFSEYPDQGIMGVIVDLAFLYPQQLLKPFREKDSNLFIKNCKRIEKGYEADKQKEIEIKAMQVAQRYEPKANTDDRIRAVKDILIQQNSPWAMEGNRRL